MTIRLPSLLKGAVFAAVLLGGALAVLPGHVGAQTPPSANLVAVNAGSPGYGLVTLNGYNGVAVTLNGGVFGISYNVYSCTSTVASPAAAGSICQLDGSIYVGSGGQATGTVSSAIPAASTAEVFVQNAGNQYELYAAAFNGAVISTSCSSGTVLGYVYGYTNCSSSTPGVACNYLNYNTSMPVCLPTGGGIYAPYYYGYGYGTYNTACVPGGGLQPVLVNGNVVWQYC